MYFSNCSSVQICKPFPYIRGKQLKDLGVHVRVTHSISGTSCSSDTHLLWRVHFFRLLSKQRVAAAGVGPHSGKSDLVLGTLLDQQSVALVKQEDAACAWWGQVCVVALTGLHDG